MKKPHVVLIPAERIERAILLVRGEKVILDGDLAALYGVETKQLLRAFKRNAARFPEDFAFRLSKEEYASLRCQIGTSKNDVIADEPEERRGGRR